MQKNTDVLVLYAPISDIDLTEHLYPESRDSEVRACRSEKSKREKYLVWKLLEKAAKEYFNLDFANLEFTKTANGKWVCPRFHFSISHTDGTVCVAVSHSPVGVDIERVREVRDALADKILTSSEKEYRQTLPECERGRFLLEAWVKKESIFKKTGGEALMPGEIETQDTLVLLKEVSVLGEKYLIAVSADNKETEIQYAEEI